MFLRRCERRKNGKRYTYWALVESYRTAQRRDGTSRVIRLHCVTEPDAAQAALLNRLGVPLPRRFRSVDEAVRM